MINRVILETGLVIEVARHTGIRMYDKSRHRIYKWAKEYDKAHPKVYVCDKTIMCLAERHKHNCAITKNYRCECWKCTGKREPYIEGVM